MKNANEKRSNGFLHVANGYLRLHQLEREGRAETPEADDLRDSLDKPWYQLSEEECERIQGLSSDLYSINQFRASGEGDLEPEVKRKLNEFRQKGENDNALRLLRQHQHVAPALVAALRGGIWLELGCPAIALDFYEYAARVVPGNPIYLTQLLHAQELVNPERAIHLAEAILEDDSWSPVVVIRAASISLETTSRQMIPSRERLLKTIQRLKIAISQLNLTDRPLLILGYSLLAQCHRMLDQNYEAASYYTLALNLDPNREALLLARGILTYGETEEAIEDLSRVAHTGSSTVWPFLLLAHHALNKGDFGTAKLRCEQGLAYEAPPIVKSWLEEWLAISIAELNAADDDRVAQHFQDAMRLYPGNETARHNYGLYQGRSTNHHTWRTQPIGEIRAFVQTESRNLLAA